MKKMLCFIMSLIVIASCSVGTNAVSLDDTDVAILGSHSDGDLFCDDFYYHILDDGTAEITDYVGTAIDLIIPDSINGYPVLCLAWNLFQNGTSLLSVTIPDSVTEIPSG